MNTQSHFIQVSPEIGKVSAEAMVPADATCLLTLAHGQAPGWTTPLWSPCLPGLLLQASLPAFQLLLYRA